MKAIGAGDGYCAFGNQLKNFIEKKLLSLLELGNGSGNIESGDPRSQDFAAANLFVQRRESEQRL